MNISDVPIHVLIVIFDSLTSHLTINQLIFFYERVLPQILFAVSAA